VGHGSCRRGRLGPRSSRDRRARQIRIFSVRIYSLQPLRIIMREWRPQGARYLARRRAAAQSDNSHMLRHAMGVLFVSATLTALALVYNAVVYFKHYWPQGLLGLALGG